MQGPAREINPWVRDVATFQEKFEKKFDTSTNIGIAELIVHRLDLIHEEQQELYKAAGQMKVQAVVVAECTVAGKLPAALQLGPLLAGIQQFVGDAAAAVFWKDKDSFQISHRARGSSLYIVVPQRTLSKSDGLPIFHRKQHSAAAIQIVLPFCLKQCSRMVRPEHLC